MSNRPGTPIGPPGRPDFPGLIEPYQVWPDSASDDDPFRQDMLVRSMGPAWNLMATVSGGTAAIRARALWYLPPEQRETGDAWAARVKKSVLSPYCSRLIENAAGAVLRKPIQISGDPYWTRFANNVDGIGSSINEFARRQLVTSLTYGHSCIFVDYPNAEQPTFGLEERLSGRRPYFNHINPAQILGWRQASTEPSAPLSQIRLLTYAREPRGDYGEKIMEQVRVIEQGRYKTISREFATTSSLVLPKSASALGYSETDWQKYSLPIIPIVPIYSNRKDVLVSEPLLLDIAYLNIAQYQRMADTLHALNVAAMPILVLEGWNDVEVAAGVNYAIRMDPGNKAYYVQSDSSSFDAQMQMLQMLEAQMSTLGITKLLGQKFVAESADAKRIDQAQANSVLSIISMELERGLQQAFNMAAAYANVDPPIITINRDLDLYRLIGQDMAVLGDLTSKGMMTAEAFVKTMHSGEIYPDSVDLQAEINAVQKAIERTKEQMAAPQQKAPTGGRPAGASVSAA